MKSRIIIILVLGPGAIVVSAVESKGGREGKGEGKGEEVETIIGNYE